ncbi:MAG TPA: hypothetical protein VN132_01025 [Bdellovibrio sp.]|nr:hypothetical protein [Bdellovibrio sp.]
MGKIILIILFSALAAQAQTISYKFCELDTEKQKLRSEELQKIAQEDQADREKPFDQIDWNKVVPRDEARRERVGQIFGEGCFKTAQDYAAAALVYQHGTIPDHAFQTFIWAKRAVELGDNTSKWLMAAGIDRYLVRSGYKQLFATQGVRPIGAKCCALIVSKKAFPPIEEWSMQDKRSSRL